MTPRPANRLQRALEQRFPERRVFLRSENDTRFIRLRPVTQILGCAGGAAIISWTIIATAILLMDSIGSGNYRDQAERDQRIYQDSLNALAQERDSRAAEAQAAQDRFNTALARVSDMQTELLRTQTRLRELETGTDVVQTGMRRALRERDAARAELAELQSAEARNDGPISGQVAEDTMTYLSAALADTAAQRDQVDADAQEAFDQADEMAYRIALMEDRNDAIFRQLEDAMSVSVEPLNQMFRSAGMNPDTLLDQVRRGYSGAGSGPLSPISFSTMGTLPDPDTSRANAILSDLENLNLYRIAATKAPFAVPVHSAFRFSSGFGRRRDPKTGGIRSHLGVDFAAPVGTPLYASGDGVVTFAGRSSGYGNLIKIQHEFGIETRYAHMSRFAVRVGQRVSRGDRIGDMGATGRVTGPHLHYEVRVNGTAVNPMTYIKAAQDVF